MSPGAGAPGPARAFVSGLVEFLSVVARHGARHGARAESQWELMDRLQSLLEEDPRPAFEFAADGVDYRGERLELDAQPWARRLAEVGVEHLELSEEVDQDELTRFLDEVAARLNVFTLDPADLEMSRFSNIRFGPAALFRVEGTEEGSFSRRVRDEFRAVEEVWEAVEEERSVPVELVRAVTGNLWITMQTERTVLQLLRPEDTSEYATAHALNVAVLSMALAKFLRFGTDDALRVGEAALLHDVGKTTVPDRILHKPGKLTRDEWTRVRLHPVRGARLLLRSGRGLELAAVVAHEHHVTRDGGYPSLLYTDELHAASRLVQVCDVYDAFCSRRPFRAPWPPERTLGYLRDRAGSHFDPGFVTAFVRMMREWSDQLYHLDPEQGAGGEVPAPEEVRYA